ncbi:serine/threonine/dual specificity protein kinase, catalytic domain-containing protein [Tanacetum coccineum]
MLVATSVGKEFDQSTSSSGLWSQPCRQFEFPEILLATENFNESLVVGSGGFGKVYKGNIVNGSSLVVVAIKRLDSMSNQGAVEFWAEVEMLSKLRHCHLVSLIGYCKYEKEMILVYEYMPHGTLEDHLHKLGTPLSWLQRLQICIGAGRGLHYLHTGTGIEFGVIHRDVKSSNILLHESWAAKISDFGLSKIGPTNQPATYVNTLVKGTFGYLDPNYFTTGRLTRKSDVYAFGVVMLEVLCRKRAVDRSLDEEQWGLATWAQDFIKEGNSKHIIDPDISSQISARCLKEFVRLVERCLHNNPKQRPTMAEIVVILESLSTVQQKTNTLLQATTVRTIFGRMFNMFLFPSNKGNSDRVDSKLPNNIKGNSKTLNTDMDADKNTIVDVIDVCKDFINPGPSLKVFKFVDLECATRNFSQGLHLGLGHFGEVFIGWIEEKSFAPSRCGDGIAVVVKRCGSSSSQGYHHCWEAEVNYLGQLTHPNIVSLLGYCNHGDENFLLDYCYEDCEMNSFADAPDISKPLSWRKRLKIMIGVARGLKYLHSSKDQVVCRGVHSSDILLDQAHYGLAKSGYEFEKTIFSASISRHQIIDPEYMRTGHFNAKSDIFGFGVVLLEILTALPAIGGNGLSEEYCLVDWAGKILADRRNLKEIMDPRLEQNYPLEGAFACGVLALRCVANEPEDRPSIEEVLKSLEQIYAIRK